MSDDSRARILAAFGVTEAEIAVIDAAEQPARDQAEAECTRFVVWAESERKRMERWLADELNAALPPS